MTYGRPGPPGTSSARRLRDQLLALGLAEDQLVTTAIRPPTRLAHADLEPAHYVPDLAPLVRRVSRLMGGARGLSLYVTGGRGEEASRRHTALQLALGVAPMGREIVVVDTDFLHPGLGGLIDDAFADGVTDMARFGRSSRSLLQKPVPDGPWLLPSGSFPEDDPAPLEADALRSVVYRISQVCHLALYVGPLPIRTGLHPLARICDHVLYATLDESPQTTVACTDAVRTLQTEGAHLLGVVAYAAASAPTTAPVLEEAPPPRFGPGFRYAPAAERPALPPTQVERPTALPTPLARPAQPAAEVPRPLAPPQVEPPAAPPEVERPAARTRETAPRLPAFLEPTAEPRITPPATSLPRREGPLPSGPAAAPVEKAPLSEPPLVELPRLDLPTLPEDGFGVEAPEPPREQPSPTPERRAVAARIPARTADEEAPVRRRDAGFTSGEYAFEEERSGPGPALLVIALLVVTLGFLVVMGPRLVTKWRASRRPASTEITPSGQQGGSAPGTVNDHEAAAAKPPTTAPNDHEAASGGTPPAPTGGTAGTAIQEPSTSAPSRAAPESTGSAPTTSRAVESTPEPSTAAPSAPPASPPRPSTSAPASPPAAAGDYGVHLASYRTLDQAQVEIRSLQGRGFAALAVRTDLGERGIWYRVIAGPYATRDEAESARTELLKLPEYKYAQVRRVPRE